MKVSAPNAARLLLLLLLKLLPSPPPPPPPPEVAPPRSPRRHIGVTADVTPAAAGGT